MAFIATNPITVPEASSQPPTPPSNTRGLFPCGDGWYDISHDGSVEKLSKGALLLWQSGRAYSAGEFVIADYNGGHAIFKCVKNVSKESGVQVTDQEYWLFLKYMSVAVDSTLTVEGAAADAKVVGDKLANRPELFTVTVNATYNNEATSGLILTNISSTFSEMLEAYQSGKILRLVATNMIGVIGVMGECYILNPYKISENTIEFIGLNENDGTIYVICDDADTWHAYYWTNYNKVDIDYQFEQLEKQIEDIVIGESNIIVDQSYDSKSTNAQSGIAVAEALQNVENNTNKVTVIDDNSDDEHYPSALAVKTYADGLKPYIITAYVSKNEESWQISDCDTKHTTITDVIEQGREVVLHVSDCYATLIKYDGLEYAFELTGDGCIYRFFINCEDTWRTEIIKLDNIVDNTLTVEGAAADAKTVGEKFTVMQSVSNIVPWIREDTDYDGNKYPSVDAVRHYVNGFITYDQIREWGAGVDYKFGTLVFTKTSMNGTKYKKSVLLQCIEDHYVPEDFNYIDEWEDWETYWMVVATFDADKAHKDGNGNIIHEHYATKSELEDLVIGESNIIVDQSYNSKSKNAQSGIAVAEALQNVENNTNKVTVIDDNSDDEHYPSALAVKTYADGLKPYIFDLYVDENFVVDGGQFTDTDITHLLQAVSQGRQVFAHIIHGDDRHLVRCDSTITTDSSEDTFNFVRHNKNYKISVNESGVWTTEVFEYATKEDIKGIKEFFAVTATISTDESGNILITDASATFEEIQEAHKAGKTITAVGKYGDNIMEAYVSISAITEDMVVFTTVSLDGIPIVIRCFSDNTWMVSINEYATKEDLEKLDIGSSIPDITNTDEGKVLKVVNGKPAWVTDYVNAEEVYY